MTIKITALGAYVVAWGKPPIVGKTYELEDVDNPTAKQNKSFHALLTVYFKSGLCSRQFNTYDEFRDQIKLHLGAGFEKIIYVDLVDGKAQIIQVKTKDEVPTRILKDPDASKMVLGKLKSWGDYTRKERTKTIDLLISEMHQAGVNSRAFMEILEGMERKNEPETEI